MKFKKFSAIMLCSMVITSSLVGCSGSTTQTNTSQTTTPSTSTSTKTEEVKVSEDGRPMDGNRYTDGKTPLVKEKETVRIATVYDNDPNEQLMVQRLEEATNVHVEWDYYARIAWPEKKNLLFASGDLPDAIMGNDNVSKNELTNYGSQGLLIPLNDYMNQDLMPNLYASIQEKTDVIPQITMYDGNIYGMPNFDDGIVPTTNAPLYVNKTWIDNLGLAVPTTTEEFYQMLKAFKEQDANKNGDPNDEIPYTFQGRNYDLFASFGSAENEEHIAQKDGVVYYPAMQPEYKEAIKYFNKLYSEGLVDPEAFTQDGTMFSAKWKAGEDGSQPRIVGAFQVWRSNKAPDYQAIEPLEGPTGIKAFPGRQMNVGTGFYITNKAKNPELLASWADQIYEPDLSLQACYAYVIGEHMELKDGKFEMTRKPDLSQQPDKGMVMDNGLRFYGVTKSNGERLFTPPHMVEKQELDLLYEDYYIREKLPVLSFNEEEAAKIADYTIDINEYVTQMYAKWVMNGGIDQEWDAYIQKLESMGVGNMVKIYQDALDRYNEIMKK